MTRFARAKGSKASNERAPEDATPWAVMKEQMHQAKRDAEEARRREQAENQRQENYQNFLNDRKTEKRKSTWCNFSSDQSNITGNSFAKKPETSYMILNSDVRSSFDNKSKKKKLKTETNTDEETKDTKIKKSKISKKNKDSKNTPTSQEQSFSEEKNIDQDNHDQYLQNNHKKNIDEDGGQYSQKKKKINNKDKVNQNHQKETNTTENHNDKNGDMFIAEQQIAKYKKKKEGKKQRRKPVDHTFKLIINGRQVDLVRFDGFPVMKKDAERLQQLKLDMTKKGIPKKEIDRTMKLERRRAEKALARIKRDVCYNCRKGGHNLSDCPDLRSKVPPAGDDTMADTNMADAADGICFKCGSAEHRAAECRVQKGQQFRFASCFICKEQGHIARQCPDNPKGLYPNGGCCRLCGDVTHLRKECPTTKTEKEEGTVKLATLATEGSVDAMLEASPNNVVSTDGSTNSRKPKKIKF